MPSRQRRTKRKSRRPVSSIGPKFELCALRTWPGDPVPTEAEWRAAWRHHREDLIEEYRRRYPGTRPAPFWEFDAPDAPPAAEPGSLAGLRYLIENGHLTREERRAILDLGGEGAPEDLQARAELVRKHRAGS